MEPTESTDIIPVSLIMQCEDCGVSYVRRSGNDDPCPRCNDTDDQP